MTQKSMLWSLRVTHPPEEVQVISPAVVKGRLVVQLLGASPSGAGTPSTTVLRHGTTPLSPLAGRHGRPDGWALDPSLE